MILKSFRVQNYKSIKDSDECHLSSDGTTVLAGMNESGKTAILEALEDFNINNDIRRNAIPMIDQNLIPRIELSFDINKRTLNQILEELGLEKSDIETNEITIYKDYPNEYSYTSQNKFLKDTDLNNIYEKEIQQMQELIEITDQLYEQYEQVTDQLPDVESYEDLIDFGNEINRYKNSFQQIQAHLTNSDLNTMLTTLDQISNLYNEIMNSSTNRSTLLQKLLELIPNFILFSSFDDIFPDEININEVDENNFIQDLILISDLDIELIKSGTPSEKKKHKVEINIDIQNEYKKYWSQDPTNISLEWDADKLQFFIEDNGDFYSPELRSKGKLWHIAFYTKISARAKENISNVILIDEPGLFLHAKAQQDILKKIDASSSEHKPIIFSTHSPYLFENDKLHRVRLISKSVKTGTKISNKIHKGASKDTLTPIITGIGYDLSLGLNIAQKNNIICEGITDYYFLNAMIKYLEYEFREVVNIIPSKSASDSMIYTPLLIGWGLNYCNLLDNDPEGKRTKNKLEKAFRDDCSIVMVSNNNDEEIEDLFDNEDFTRLVLKEDDLVIPETTTNSKYIKKNQYDKVLLSKLFYEAVIQGNIELSDKTVNKFRNLLERLDNKLFKSTK